MFLSTYSSNKLLTFKSLDDVYYVLGIEDKVIIQPPRCPICGEFVYVDSNLGMYQCSYCNKTGVLYQSPSLNLRKEWNVYGSDKR